MKKYSSVSIWLLIGCILVLGQILIGGITRLTDSGLSITEWDVIKGTIPPLDDGEWNASFEKYKKIAKKQFESIHRDMTMDEFKKIYFWEYFHRLWARMMGFIFFIPFVFFLIRRRISFQLILRLIFVLFLASLAAIFGWIMVASGLNNDKRTWVNAYNLLGHLAIAVCLYSYLLYMYYQYKYEEWHSRIQFQNYTLWKWIGFFLLVQMGFGGLMAGMKAGLVLPHPFLVLKYQSIQEILQSHRDFNLSSFYDYEPNPIIKIIIQILHRSTAYLLVILTAIFMYQNRSMLLRNFSLFIFVTTLVLQIIIGVFTVSFSIGKIPILWGVFHQMTAFLLLSSYIWMLFIAKKK